MSPTESMVAVGDGATDAACRRPQEVRQAVASVRAWLAGEAAAGRRTCPVPEGALKWGGLPAPTRPNAPVAGASRPGAAAAAAAAGAAGPGDAAAGVAGPAAAAGREPAAAAAGAALAALATELAGCRACRLAERRTHVVVGTGPAGAHLMLVGEAPGRDEDLQGEPFVGESGRLLDRMLAAMGLSRPAVYIANIVKCRPPRNRDPERDEVAACAPFLARQVALVAPRVVVALGRFAAQALLEDASPISRLRGRWRTLPSGAARVMPTFHPAYLLRNPAAKREVWSDLQAVMEALSMPPPTRYNPRERPRPFTPREGPTAKGQ